MRTRTTRNSTSSPRQLVEMTRLVGSAIGRATTPMLDADLKLAESVIAADQKVDALQHDLEARAIALLARQQPVATDLRIVVTALRMSADLERMGDLARHVAKLARLRYPGHGGAGRDLHATILQMGQVAERIVAKAGRGHHQPRTSSSRSSSSGRRRDGRPAPRRCSST